MEKAFYKVASALCGVIRGSLSWLSAQTDAFHGFSAQTFNSIWNCTICRVYNQRPYFNIVASLVTNAISMLTVIRVYIRPP